MADFINVSQIQDTATQYKQELLKLAALSVDEAIKHMTVVAGVQDEYVLPTIATQALLKPYTKTWSAAEKAAIVPRTLKVRAGKVELEEEPEKYRNTLLGKTLTGAINPNTHPFERYLMESVARQISEDINSAIFAGKYNGIGTDPLSVFDGFDKIIDDEISATNISVAKGNMANTGAITSSNAYDTLKAFYRAADPVLRKQPTKLFVSWDIYDKYVDDYQSSNGSLPYNQSFDKMYLEGSANMCEIVPLTSKGVSQRMVLTTQENTYIGVDQLSDKEVIKIVETGNPWVIGIAAKLVFGVQFASIDKRVFLVNELSTGSASV